MNRSRIIEMRDETGRLNGLTERLYELLAVESGKIWQGEAYDACLRESHDNREQALEMISDCKKILDMTGSDPEPEDRLLSGFLL